MSKKSTLTILTVAAAAAALTTATTANAEKAMEKCYGVVKKGKNDCGTSVHSCAGQSTVDGAPDEWLYLPTGTCERLVGGSTK